MKIGLGGYSNGIVRHGLRHAFKQAAEGVLTRQDSIKIIIKG